MRAPHPAPRVGIRRRWWPAPSVRGVVRGTVRKLLERCARDHEGPMIITDVEALLLRQPGALDTTIADGSQDALIVRVTTDTGIAGIGEVDSNPTVIKSIIEAPPSHKTACGLRSLLIGEDPADIPRLWQRMYRGSPHYCRRGAAARAIRTTPLPLRGTPCHAPRAPLHPPPPGSRPDPPRPHAST